MAHDKNVRVHRVTQYFRGRPANKGAGKEDKMHGKGRWQQQSKGEGKGRLVRRTGSLACAKGILRQLGLSVK